MKVIVGIILTLSLFGLFNCGEYEDAEAEGLAETFELFEEYKQYFQNKEELKKGLKELFADLKTAIKEEEAKRKGKTLENEVEAYSPEGEAELDQAYAEYSDEIAQYIKDNEEDLLKGKQEIDEVFANGLEDEFAQAKADIEQEKQMYEENKKKADEYLAMDYTTGEGKKLIDEAVKEAKAEIQKELPAVMEEAKEIEEEQKRVVKKAIEKVKAEHPEEMADVEKIKGSAKKAEDVDKLVEEEIANFNIDPYLADPEADKYEEQLKEMLKAEIEESVELQKMELEEAKQAIEDLEAKWNDEAQKQEILADKELFSQWFQETLQAFKDPALLKQKYDAAKEQLKQQWNDNKEEIEKEAEEQGYTISEDELMASMEAEIDALKPEDIDAAIDQYAAEIEELKAGNYESINFLEEVPKAAKFRSKMLKKLRKHK